ncbi:hypothetical protein RJ640_011429 [Escallonia rubra]|uniref:Bifunctional inhibitor/plant lipid transfer protein/seed storage helical domain-containing protein n=1 Tax=Escallonia rubra TaxID=112253 RepID=A0AA88RK96_9ASTE|nr:hypothetical protein RJ640_011429 [Escallonia rubra]
MATDKNPVRYVPAAIALLFALTLVLIATNTAPPPLTQTPDGCSDELVAFSPCVPYVSAPPNDLSDSPSPQCCAAFASGAASCLCYLLRQPMLYGFPVNRTRLVSLSSRCPSKDGGSLEALCAGSPTLPPLRSTTGPDNSSSLINSPPESADDSLPQGSDDSSSTTKPSSTVLPAKSSSASNQISSSLIIVIVFIFN